MFSRHVVLVAVVLAAALGAAAPADSPADARHYVLVYGGQKDVLRPATAHVWATYVRTTGHPDMVTTVDAFTISWLPVSGAIRPLAIQSEPGRNYSLDETLAFMCGPRQRIALWGPYDISECRYLQACRQKAVLDSGSVRYKVNDWFDRRGHIDHCMHAVTRAHPDVHAGCWLVRGIGERAAAQAVCEMARTGMICRPYTTHDWLLPALGLDRQTFVRRSPCD